MTRRGVAIALTFGIIAAGAAAWSVARARRAAEAEAKAVAAVRDGVARARLEREGGRPDLAARRLAALDAEFPGRAEVALERGLNELARGRPDAARAWLARVPAGDPRAAAPLAQIEILRGRFAAAEDLLRAALGSTEAATPDRRAARDALVRLLRSEGRLAEARQVFLDGFGEWPDPVVALRGLERLDSEPLPLEGLRVYLGRAARAAPDDDRVALGLASLATRLGRDADAARQLDACLARRPDDPAVWRARLEHARATGRPDLARPALAHLPADPAEAEDLRAWLAARRHDPQAERAALERLTALDPGRVDALERLAELALAAGRPADAAALRDRHAALNRDRDAYRRLLAAPDARDHAAELAELAARLGLRFEAGQWSRLAGRAAPAAPAAPKPGETLADLVPEMAAVTAQAGPAPAETAAADVPLFEDAAGPAGLRFAHESGGATDQRRMSPPVTFGGGVGLLDADGDGWLDVYCVQGGAFPPVLTQSTAEGDRLFRNRGDGTFEDATEKLGLPARSQGYGYGLAVGDVDNDGRPDVFVTRWRAYALYRNTGKGFEDVTDRWGLGGDHDWPTSAALADLDGDGDLDLYVCHYLRWDAADDARACQDPRDPSRYRCNPRDFEARADHVFRNDGGRFVDVSAGAGVTAADRDGRGLGVVAADLDGDGRTDLFVANDMTANYLFINKGGFRFEESALAAGVAGNATGAYQAGMGVACGDADGDGLPDLVVTNFYGESTTLFRNLGGGSFADRTAAAGLAAPTRDRLGFGAAFLDADNDGYVDLLTANGHIHDGRPQFPWKMAAQLLRGGPGGRFTDVTDRAGPAVGVPHLGRGLAVGDLDHDGRVDALLAAQDEPLVYLQNRTPRAGGSLVLHLEGRPPGSNRDAVGAAVTVEAGGRTRTAWRLGGGSYLAAGSPRVQVGLGQAPRADRVEVRWPSGRRDAYGPLGPGGYRLREGDPTPARLPSSPTPAG